MKSFGQLIKSLLWGWGITAFVIAVASLFSPDTATLRLLRILLIEETITTVVAHLIFTAENWNAGIWIKRIVSLVSCSVIGFAVIVLSTAARTSWQLCFLFGAGAATACVAFLIADVIERRTLDRINEKLSRNEFGK